MPEKFSLEFDGKSGKKCRPVIIHRTVYGGIERFLGILIEHFKGEFPLWLSPIQIKVICVKSDNLPYAREVFENLKEVFRVEMDHRNESIGKKVREAVGEKVNYIINIGDKEQKDKTIAVRDRKGGLKLGVNLKEFIKELKQENDCKSIQ
jgi:threonyl-tRNA synthetase